ncbi:porin [Paraburkholderia sp. DHOC27]|uniref:porin n=1 Tax=Paraburkholderia sp. DHOC27 TaxID=2303330 RepID=UPI000E3DD1D2|nr:porin [Paraburkholderia sp. DHOC27]RFU44560.1 porin [Paraburkholderia sp. DHOC27]
MKRIALSTLSLALLGAAGVAHAQSSVTLYGTIDTSITYVHNASGNNSLWSIGNSSGGDLSGTRWGVKGNEDLGGGLKAIFQLENGFNPSTGGLGQGSRLFGRQAFVGLASDQFGTVTLGRQYDPLVDMVQGITEDNYFGSAFATVGDVDNYDNSSRTNNAIKYVSPVFSGLQVEGMYAFGGVAGQTGSGQTWSAAATYNNGPFSIAAGYFVADNPTVTGLQRTTWGGTSDGTFDGSLVNLGFQTARSINIARVAGQYVAGPFTFGLGYSNSQYKSDGQSAFVSTEKYNTGQGFVNYQATPAMLVGLGYSYTRANGVTGASYNQVSVGGDYNLSKRTDVYLVGAYQHASGNTLNADATAVVSAQASIGSYGYGGTSTQELVSLGLRHKF